jgi:uncharacterized SAM-binding protein YcdF (DUF218 family)
MTSKALFLISSLAWDLVRPSSVLVLALLLGFSLSLTVFRRMGMVVLAGVIVALLAVMILPVGQWAMGSLERQFPPNRDEPSHVDGIIVLGGAVVPSLTETWHMPALTDDAERMTAFAALARRHPEARLVFSGGGGVREPGRLREADVAYQLFEQLGVDVGRMQFERESINTWENAVFSQCQVKPQPDETWLLVTSAFHMPRAISVFQKIGWNVVAWPVGFKSDPAGEFFWGVNLPKGLHLLDDAIHEWVGTLEYHILGRSGGPVLASFPLGCR